MSTIDELRGLVRAATRTTRPAKLVSDREVIPPEYRGVANGHYGVLCISPEDRQSRLTLADELLFVAAVNALPALLAVAEAAREIKNCGSMLSMQGPWDRLHKALARLDGEVGHE